MEDLLEMLQAVEELENDLEELPAGLEFLRERGFDVSAANLRASLRRTDGAERTCASAPPRMRTTPIPMKRWMNLSALDQVHVEKRRSRSDMLRRYLVRRDRAGRRRSSHASSSRSLEEIERANSPACTFRCSPPIRRAFSESESGDNQNEDGSGERQGARPAAAVCIRRVDVAFPKAAASTAASHGKRAPHAAGPDTREGDDEPPCGPVKGVRLHKPTARRASVAKRTVLEVVVQHTPNEKRRSEFEGDDPRSDTPAKGRVPPRLVDSFSLAHARVMRGAGSSSPRAAPIPCRADIDPADVPRIPTPPQSPKTGPQSPVNARSHGAWVSARVLRGSRPSLRRWSSDTKLRALNAATSRSSLSSVGKGVSMATSSPSSRFAAQNGNAGSFLHKDDNAEGQAGCESPVASHRTSVDYTGTQRAQKLRQLKVDGNELGLASPKSMLGPKRGSFVLQSPSDRHGSSNSPFDVAGRPAARIMTARLKGVSK